MVAYLSIILLLISCSYSYAEISSPPEFLKQPPSDEILFQVREDDSEYDKPALLVCEALGEPTPRYYWTKNGKPFNWEKEDDRISQQPGRGSLVFFKPNDEDAGQYQCFAENDWGVATSNSFFLRKIQLKSFEDISRITLEGKEGEPFKLDCQLPYGYPEPKAYWVLIDSAGSITSINNSRITPDPGGNLWFSSLTPQDASDDFMYTCAVSSATRHEYKIGKRVHLNVVSSDIPPSAIEHKPILQYASKETEVAVRGKRVELFCIYGGTPLPQTVWYKDGKPIQYDDRISKGNYGKSVIIKSVDFSDQGTYTCDVSNGVAESKSHSITLEVFAVPYFTVEPKSVNAGENEAVEFHCKATGFPEPQIEWIYNGKPLEEAPPNLRRKIEPNRVVIENVNKNDIANYGCNASNHLGYTYKDVYLNVLALPPETTQPPEDKEVVNGKDIVLPCNVNGVPKPTVKWTRYGKELNESRYKFLENGNLHISSVHYPDTGEYTCHAENKFGSTDALVTLIVKGRTEIVYGPENYETDAGANITFHCLVVLDSNLDLEIVWLRNENPIDFDVEPRFIKNADNSLTVQNTSELDTGLYTCNAKTRLDEISASASLTIRNR